MTINYLRFVPIAIAALANSYPLLSPPVAHSTPTAPLAQTPSSSQFVNRGTQIFLNGKTLTIPWAQWRSGAQMHLGISDTALSQQLGVELFNNSSYTSQPLDWYATQNPRTTTVPAKLSRQYRYLDITSLASKSNWRWQVAGAKLQLNTPPTRVIAVQRQTAPNNSQLNVTLDRATPWKLSQTPTEGYLTIEATATPTLLAQFNAVPPPSVDRNLDPDDDPNDAKIPYKVTSNNNQTIVQFPIVKGQRARAKLLSPTQLEVRLDSNLANIPEREIKWAPGLNWRQKWLKLGPSNFPATYLEINPRQGVKLGSTLAEEPNLVGTNHLIKSAPQTEFAAAINGGYFNRNTRMPLGALKRNGKWLSSPILNRGAIGWNDRGQLKIARLQMSETVTTDNGESLPLSTLNSGYAPSSGIARYTSAWSQTYSPIQANESIAIVQGERVTQVVTGTTPGSISVPIPNDGYLLALRGQPDQAESIAVGTRLTLQTQILPSTLDPYPNIVAAGPWLLQASKVVLDPKTENFSAKFSKELAARSAIATTATGNILIVTIHDRAGGKGPTLTEMALLMRQLGAVDALNLDGGSSTSLYLGGQLINRASATAARIHNAIGISLAPLP